MSDYEQLSQHKMLSSQKKNLFQTAHASDDDNSFFRGSNLDMQLSEKSSLTNIQRLKFAKKIKPQDLNKKLM